MNGFYEWAIVGGAVVLLIVGWTVFCYFLARWADERNTQNAIKSRQWQLELAGTNCGRISAHAPHVFADDDAQQVLLRCPGVPR